MELKRSGRSIACFILTLFAVLGSSFPEAALAGSAENVAGFAWSQNIGWISSNCTDTGTCGTSDYGVNIGNDRTISGYAWSENIGWIDFNEADLAGCPSGSCKAWVETCSAGQCPVSGWARVLASGGGWDGWIKLGGTAQDGSPYPLYVDPATGEFHGWAWSDAVLGWISFNCQERGVCGISDYKLKTTYTFVNTPLAAMACDGSQCGGGTCDAATWISYRPIADPEPCIYTIVNNSTDPDGLGDIVSTVWEYKIQGDPDSSYQPIPGCPQFNGISNCTIQSGIPAGNYTFRLTVADSTSNSSSVTHDISIKSEARAGFMCSLDDASWQTCSSLSNSILKDELVYFKDDPSLAEYSAASDGESIVLREWTLNGVAFGGNNASVSEAAAEKDNKIRLKITDSAGRTDYEEYDLRAKSLPEWEEVGPMGLILNKFLAGINRVWNY